MALESPVTFQTTVVRNPTIIPAKIPSRVTRFEYKINKIAGPKLAPSPDQANKTNQNKTKLKKFSLELFFSLVSL